MSPQEAGSASGHGIATVTFNGAVLDTWFPNPVLGKASPVPAYLEQLLGRDEEREVNRQLVSITIDLTASPKEPSDVYLRLHLLSHRLVAPPGQSFEGIFGILNTVVWTSHGP